MWRPKSKGSRRMLSEFSDDITGYRALTDDEFKRAYTQDITITQRARPILEYGESREG